MTNQSPQFTVGFTLGVVHCMGLDKCRTTYIYYLIRTVKLLFFKRFYLSIFREKGREGEKEGEKRQCVVASCAPPTGDLACNPGMCTDWESNQQCFGL